MDEQDRALLAEKSVGCVHNPTSNMKLASGAAPVTALRAAGVAVGLGTDGAASNNDLNLFEEMDLAAKLQKLSSGDPKALPAADALALATVEGARALGLEQEIGSLEAGKRADLIMVRRSRAARHSFLRRVRADCVHAQGQRCGGERDQRPGGVAGRPGVDAGTKPPSGSAWRSTPGPFAPSLKNSRSSPLTQAEALPEFF